jgi:hypothetical protein
MRGLMKRTMIRLGVCLGTGAVASVAIACAAALWEPLGSEWITQKTRSDELMLGSGLEASSGETRWTREGFAIEYTAGYEYWVSGSCAQGNDFVLWRAGWPSAALICRNIGPSWDPPSWLAAADSSWLNPLASAIGGPIHRIVPLQIRWAGMAANTGVCGLLAWAGLFGLRRGRRYRWDIRGTCRRCGYNATGLVRCPECGRASVGETTGRKAVRHKALRI